MSPRPGSLKLIWREACEDKFFLVEFFLSFILLTITMLTFSSFMQFVEARSGVQFIDPFLARIPTFNLTWAIFSFIYGAILLGLTILVYNPVQLVLLFESYSLMVLVRIVMMYLLPLNTPPGMIVLEDPFVSLFVTGKTLTKDLFFSGHTATMFLLFLVAPARHKKYFFIATVFVASGVLLQKVHYTVDVVVAPFVSFAAFYCVKKTRSLLKQSSG